MHDMTHPYTPDLHTRLNMTHSLVCVSTMLFALTGYAQETTLPPSSEWAPYVVRQPQKISQLLDVLTLPNDPALALQALQEHNRPLDLNQLQSGQTLRIPKTWFRQDPAPLKVTRIRCTGKAEPSTSNQQSLYPGMSLGEGEIINVPGGCQVSISLRDGSQLQLPSSSVVQIDTLRDSPDTGQPQVKLKLLQGKISLSLFKKRPTGSTFEVATPRATTGVRGTEFRVSHDADSDTSAVEVLQGEVQTHAQASSEDQAISALQGAIIRAEGPIQVENLPSPPELVLQGQVWEWQNLQATTQYVRQDLQAINETPGWQTPQAKPGADIPTNTMTANEVRYIQTAGISPSGLMGATATFALCQSVASLPLPVCPVRFQIDEAGERATRLNLREHKTDSMTAWVSTRPRNPNTREVIALLPPGHYEWQLQGYRIDDATPIERTTAGGQFKLLNNPVASSHP
jgi:hypothetical protein